METGEICRRLARNSLRDIQMPRATKSSADAVHGAGESTPGGEESGATSSAASSTVMARQSAKAKRRWQRAALMQPNMPAIVPISSSVQMRPACIWVTGIHLPGKKRASRIVRHPRYPW